MKKVYLILIAIIWANYNSYAQRNSTAKEEFLIEQELINLSVKKNMGIEYINEGHATKNGKIFISKIPINITTYLSNRPVKESREYECIAGYSNDIDIDMYQDFIERNKTSISIDTVKHYNEYIIQFTSLEQAEAYTNPKLNAEEQAKVLFDFFGKSGIVLISRPGFNKDRTRAIIYVSYKASYMNEHAFNYNRGGTYYIYEYTDKGWKYKDSVLLG